MRIKMAYIDIVCFKVIRILKSSTCRCFFNSLTKDLENYGLVGLSNACVNCGRR